MLAVCRMSEGSDPAACVIAGATPEQVRAVGASDRIAVRANKLGTLVTGRPDGLVIDYAAELRARSTTSCTTRGTGWFAVTIYTRREPAGAVGQSPRTRTQAIRASTTSSARRRRATILDALDVPADDVGYALA